MFERFTDRGRRVVVCANDEARLLNHNYIGTEHILLGILREGEGVAAKALTSLGISLEEVRTQVHQIIGQGRSSPSGHIPFTPRAKKVLELSLREATQLGHNYIGTEHILLGLIREAEGVAAQILIKLGADLSRVRQEVINLLSGYSPMLPQAAEGPQSPHTPATLRAADQARKLAGKRPVGTQHMSRAILDDEDSLGARALAALGVTRETLEATLATLTAAESSDELPEEAGARRTTVEVRDGRVAVVIEDDGLAEALTGAAGREGLVLRSGEAGSEPFPALWQDVTRRLTAVVARLERAAAERWRPPEWDGGWTVAAYAAYQHPAGVRSVFEVAEGADRDAMASAVGAWLTARQPLNDQAITYLTVLVDTGEDGDLVFRLHTGQHPEWPRTRAHFLVAHAILELSQPPAATGTS